MAKIGSIRPSQLITNFGPGSIVNLEHDTVMILGLQFWKENSDRKKYYKIISHPYLSRQLSKSHFKMPISDSDKAAIPCISFPQWGVCQNCRRLQKHSNIPGNEKPGFLCRFCESDLPLFRATFIQICDNGHIQEFPWGRWAHSLKKPNAKGVVCTRTEEEGEKLEYRATHKGTSLSNFVVKCLHCEESRNMVGVTNKEMFKQIGVKKCFGEQPWLGRTDRKKCDKDTFGIQVNSSAVYYSSTVTSLLIPKWIHDVDSVLAKNESHNLHRIEADLKDKKSYEQIIDWHADGMFKEILKKYSKRTIIERLRLRFDSADLDISTESQALEQEFDSFSEIIKRKPVGQDHDLKIDMEPILIKDTTIEQYGINRLMKFHRLISVQVLRGFTRGTPPDPYATERQIENPLSPISSGSKKDSETGDIVPINWLPAIETKGEGIFFQFDEKILQNWEKRPKVKERFRVMVENYAENIDAHNRSKKETVQKKFDAPRYVLLHTFAHLLIREIASHAGYNEASLRERIYSTSEGKMRNGILIYTSSPSSEGSLGGVVRLGEIKVFDELIENTIKRSSICSRDPLCMEMNPVVIRDGGILSDIQISGSSCYSCTLLPETCCQNFNNLLDRWMLRDPEDGFFREQIKRL